MAMEKYTLRLPTRFLPKTLESDDTINAKDLMSDNTEDMMNTRYR